MSSSTGNEKKNGWAGVLILAVAIAVLAAVFVPVLLSQDPGLRFGRGDLWAYFWPMAFFMDHAIDQGALPLWNGLVLCGMPFRLGVFYPPMLLRSLLTPGPSPWSSLLSLKLMVMAHLLLALLSTYGLARDHRLSPSASLVAGLACGLSANFMRRVLAHWTFIGMGAWMPLMLLLLRRGLRSETPRDRLSYALGLGIVTGVCFLVGDAQLMMYQMLALLVYAVLYRALHGTHGEGWARTLRGDGLLLALGLGLAALIILPVAVQLIQMAGFSPRAKELGETFHYNPEQRVAPLYFLRGLIYYPGITYPGSVGLRFAGAGPFLLALLAVFHRSRRDVLVYGGLFLVLIDCALGYPFPMATLLDLAAPFRLTVPARAAMYACLPLALLAGFGADAGLTAVRGRWRQLIRSGIALALGLGVLMPLYRWVSPDPFMPVSRLVWCLPLGGLAILVITPWLRRPERWRPVVAGLVLFEILVWNAAYIPHLAQGRPFAEGAEPGFGESKAYSKANGRGVGPYWQENRLLFELKPSITGYDPVFIERVLDILRGSADNAYYARRLHGGQVLRDNPLGNHLFKRRFWLARQYVAGPMPPADTLFPSASTVFLEEGISVPVPQVDRDTVTGQSVSERVKVVEVPPESWKDVALAPKTGGKGGAEAHGTIEDVTIPPVHAVMRLHYAGSVSGTLAVDFTDRDTGRVTAGWSHAVHPSEVPVPIEIPLPDVTHFDAAFTLSADAEAGEWRLTAVEVLCDEADENGLIAITAEGANFIEVSVGPLDAPRILTYLDAAYPGWQALVDGAPTPILLAEDAFKAVVVPPGTHRVRFVYRPAPLYASMGLGIAGAMLAAAMLFALGIPQRRERTHG